MAPKTPAKVAPKPEERAATRIVDLSQLAPDDVDVRIVVDDKTELLVPMRTLSWAKWEAIGETVPHPIPDPSGVTAGGKLTYDYQDPAYLKRVSEANTERAYKRLLAMLRLPIPGDNEQAQIDFLKGLDANYINQLMTAGDQLARGGRASIEARAAAFQQRG